MHQKNHNILLLPEYQVHDSGPQNKFFPDQPTEKALHDVGFRQLPLKYFRASYLRQLQNHQQQEYALVECRVVVIHSVRTAPWKHVMEQRQETDHRTT